MSVLLYDFFLFLYGLAAGVASLFNDKARKWRAGRKGWQQRVASALRPGEKRIWIHCSSVGEFEQAKPLISALKAQYIGYKIVVTFFSPSGYEACSKSPVIDYAFYLPTDSSKNARKFADMVNPVMAMFIKYEFWYHYIEQMHSRGIPVLLVSGAFRPGQVFFRWYGGLFRHMLSRFTFFFVQDSESVKMLGTLAIADNVVLSGDTRYDRVAEIAKNIQALPAIEKFRDGNKILIAGSTWPGDEDVLKEGMAVLPAGWKLVIAPHEVHQARISHVQHLFGSDAVLFSELSPENAASDKRVLIINNIGMLSRLYAYGDIAFVGGGFQQGGIHNILEPAVFGLPVVFGPVYEKFVEAKQMAALHYVFPVNNAADCRAILKKLAEDEVYRADLLHLIKTFIEEHRGATGIITRKIKNEGWLG